MKTSAHRFLNLTTSSTGTLDAVDMACIADRVGLQVEINVGVVLVPIIIKTYRLEGGKFLRKMKNLSVKT